MFSTSLGYLSRSGIYFLLKGKTDPLSACVGEDLKNLTCSWDRASESFMSVGDTTVPGATLEASEHLQMHVQRLPHSDIPRKGPRVEMVYSHSIHSFIHLVFQWIQWGRAVHSASSEFNQLLRVSCTRWRSPYPCVRNSVEMGKQTSHLPVT